MSGEAGLACAVLGSSAAGTPTSRPRLSCRHTSGIAMKLVTDAKREQVHPTGRSLTSRRCAGVRTLIWNLLWKASLVSS